LAKAMGSLPEYRPVSKQEIRVSGQVNHAHTVQQLPKEEQDRIIRLAAEAIDMEEGEDGSFGRPE